jgi:uncharacterized protein YjbI with pentapeptide repeats
MERKTISGQVILITGTLEYLGDPQLLTIPSEVCTQFPDGSSEISWIRLQNLDLTGKLDKSVRIVSASLFRSIILQSFTQACFSNSTFQESQVAGSRFENSDFIECAFDFADCQGAVFSNCEIDASFGMANLSDCTFSNCTITGNFQDATLNRAIFTNCHLSGNFENTQCQNIRFEQTTAGYLNGNLHLIAQLFAAGLSGHDKEEFVDEGYDLFGFEPEPADETEAWYQRWLNES